jgi:hypothetical protein
MVKIWDIYVVDFVEVVTFVQVYKWYYCSLINITFNNGAFPIFNNFINFQSDVLSLVWLASPTCLDPNVMWCAFCMGTKLA